MHVCLILIVIFYVRVIVTPLPLWEDISAAAPAAIWPDAMDDDFAPTAPATGAVPAMSLGEMVRWLRRFTEFECSIRYSDARASL